MEPKLTPRTTELLQAGAFGQPGTLQGIPLVGAISGLKVEKTPLKPERVAIIGTAPSSRNLAPWGDPSWTIWGSSPGNMGDHGDPSMPMALPRVDAWIEIHSNFLWPEYRATYGHAYVKWVNSTNIPVLAPIDVGIYKELFPKAMQFPWKELIDRFGRRFFTSTFAWMMAYAINQGVKELGLWGVDMSSRDEYIQQRPGGHYFIEMAERAGIKVTIPPESDLAQPPPLYGIVDSTPFGRKLAVREQEIRARIQQAEQRQAQAQSEITYLKGALEDVDYHRNIWAGLA